MIKLRMFNYNFAYTILNQPYTVLKESKQSFYSTKNSLFINLKEKLQKPFDVRRAIFSLLTCWLKNHVVLSWGGIGQLNCDKRSQQHVEAIYGSFDFIGLHVPPEKHPTENGVIAGKLQSH